MIGMGLDSSTTYQFIKWMCDTCHTAAGTMLVALLQPYAHSDSSLKLWILRPSMEHVRMTVLRAIGQNGPGQQSSTWHIIKWMQRHLPFLRPHGLSLYPPQCVMFIACAGRPRPSSCLMMCC